MSRNDVTRPLFLLRARVVELAVLILLCAAHFVRADIVIVKASDAEPYAQADAALRERLGTKIPTRTVLLKQVADKAPEAKISGNDVVVAIGTPAARWLHKQLPDGVKLTYCMVTNAEESGLLDGKPCFGVTTDVALADQFKLIAETLPKAKTIGTLYRSDSPAGKKTLQQLKDALPPGWKVEAVAVNEKPSVAEAIEALTQLNVDLIWTTTDQKLYDTAAVRTLLLAALRSKIPVWGFSPAFVRAGGLIGVGVEPRSQGIEVADLVKKLLDDPLNVKDKSRPPDDFQIAVNLIVAEQLGIEIPESLLHRAAYVYRPEK